MPIDVLVVEDDADIAHLACAILEAEGYTAASAAHGREALHWLESAPECPRVLVVDLSMPVMDGPTLIAHLAASPRWHTLPIVVMTAEWRPKTLPHSHAIVRIIPKPFHLETLVEAVAAALASGAVAA